MRNILITAGLCFSFLASAQKQEIEATLQQYFQLISDKEISKALDYVHPGLIDMVGKAMFEQQYKQLFNSPGLEVEIGQFSIDTISETHAVKKKQYALVDYSFYMTFKVDVSADTTGLLPDLLMSSYQTQFGKENVTSDTPGTYLIHTFREMFAVREPEFEGWRILDYEKGMRILVESIIPESVLTHFNK